MLPQVHAYSLRVLLKYRDLGFSLPAGPCVIGPRMIFGTFQGL